MKPDETMSPQEIADDRLMHYHAHQCCQLPSVDSRRVFLFEIGDKYGADWREEVQKRVQTKWEADKAKKAA